MASLREVTKAFMCFAMNVNGSTINAALCRESVLYIYVASVEKEKKNIFHLSCMEKTFFHFVHSSSFQRHGFHNDQENVEIISFFFLTKVYNDISKKRKKNIFLLP